MPEFKITTENSKDAEESDERLHFSHAKAATDDAQTALAEMASDVLPNGKSANFNVKVEDAGGKEIYRASMNFVAKSEDDIARDDREADEVASNIGGGRQRD